jgi:hypothetical protein
MIFSPWCQTQLFETKINGGKQGASHWRKYITPANEIATMIFGGFYTDFPNDPDSRIAAQSAFTAFCFCLANVLRLRSPRVTVPLFTIHCVEQTS